MWKDYLSKEKFEEGRHLINVVLGVEAPTQEEKEKMLPPIDVGIFLKVESKLSKTKSLQDIHSVFNKVKELLSNKDPDSALKLLAEHYNKLVDESKKNKDLLRNYGWALVYTSDLGHLIDKNYEDIKRGEIKEEIDFLLNEYLEETKLISMETMIPFALQLYQKAKEKIREIV
jgi:hypothetical protein